EHSRRRGLQRRGRHPRPAGGSRRAGPVPRPLPGESCAVPGVRPRARRGRRIRGRLSTLRCIARRFRRAPARPATPPGAWQRGEGLEAEWLDAVAVQALEPALSTSLLGAARFVGDHQVDNRLLVRALAIAATRSGARVVATQVRRLLESGGRVVGVVTDQGVMRADAVVVAAGACTGLVPGALSDASILRPARGQMAMVHTRAPVVRHVVFGAQGYAVPRPDGRLLLGSTVEFVGFDKQVTAGGLAAILSRGIALIPAIAEATLLETWAGFRPHTADGLPL